MESNDLSRRNMLAAAVAGGAASLFGGRTLFAQAEAGGMVDATTLMEYFKPTNFFDAGEWKLPKLPYAYDALEPHIDAKTMEIHHSKHHKAYVDNLNKAVKKLATANELEPGAVEGLQRDISFNLGGHVLHSVFWGVMGKSPEGKMGGEPTGKVAEMINATFGDYAKFKAYFTKVATSVKGSGWAVLGHSPVSNSLVTFAVKDQDSTQPAGVMPILGIDVWEHAYYLKYQNARPAYVEAWFNTINWTAVNAIVGMHGAK